MVTSEVDERADPAAPILGNRGRKNRSDGNARSVRESTQRRGDQRLVARCAPGPSNCDDDEESEARWISANDAVEPVTGFLTSALDAYCRGFAIRVVTALGAFERWATTRGFDASVLLSVKAPWVADKLAEHARWLDAAEPDETVVEQLLASLPTGRR